MTEQKHKLGAYRVAGTGIREPVYLTEPKAHSKFRGLIPKSCNKDYQLTEVLLTSGASNYILKYSQGPHTSEESQQAREIKTGRRKLMEVTK